MRATEKAMNEKSPGSILGLLICFAVFVDFKRFHCSFGN